MCFPKSHENDKKSWITILCSHFLLYWDRIKLSVVSSFFYQKTNTWAVTVLDPRQDSSYSPICVNFHLYKCQIQNIPQRWHAESYTCTEPEKKSSPFQKKPTPKPNNIIRKKQNPTDKQNLINAKTHLKKKKKGPQKPDENCFDKIHGKLVNSTISEWGYSCAEMKITCHLYQKLYLTSNYEIIYLFHYFLPSTEEYFKNKELKTEQTSQADWFKSNSQSQLFKYFPCTGNYYNWKTHHRLPRTSGYYWNSK